MNKSQQKKSKTQQRQKPKRNKASRRNVSKSLSGKPANFEPKSDRLRLNSEYDDMDFEGYSSWRVVPASTQGGMRIKGRELVAQVRTTASGPGETNAEFVLLLAGSTALNSFYLHPLVFPRLTNFTPIFEYYKFQNVKFSFVPSQNVTTNGTLFVGVDMQADDPAVGSIAQVMGNMCSSAFPIYSKGHIPVPNGLSRVDRYICDFAGGTGTALVQEIQAIVNGRYAGQSSTLLGLTVTHFMYAEYDCEFFSPTLDVVTIPSALKSMTLLMTQSERKKGKGFDGRDDSEEKKTELVAKANAPKGDHSVTAVKAELSSQSSLITNCTTCPSAGCCKSDW